MTHFEKITLQILLLLAMIALAIFAYLPLINLIDARLAYHFEFLMLLFGLFLGIIYHLIGLINSYYQKKKHNRYLAYLLDICQPSFLITNFVWYGYLYANKLLAENKIENSYFQTIMVGSSIFFLTVKIGKEVANLKKVSEKH